MESRQSSPTEWDHSSHEQFYEYYATESVKAKTRERFRAIRDAILRTDWHKQSCPPYDVADIGCGPGTQSLLWAELGHRVHAVDINQPLLDLARSRATAAGLDIEFLLGSAVSLPLPDSSIDVCLAVELLEHVADWQSCLKEFGRVLRPRGVLFLSTTNKLCPIQSEFNLTFYSWYPGPVKRYCEHLAVTTHPGIANYAKYPAVNWFSFYSLRRLLKKSGFECLDRFDVMNISTKGVMARAIVSSLRTFRVLRWVGHVGTPGTSLLAIKRRDISGMPGL